MRNWAMPLVVLLAVISVGYANAAVVTLQPGPTGVKDTWIWAGEDYSHGHWAELRTNRVSSHDQKILVEFTDLSMFPAGLTTINSAHLGLYRYDAYGNNPLTIDAHQITSSWVETVTWSTQPNFSASVEDSVTVTTNGWYEWDLTSLVQQWVDGSTANSGVGIYNHGTDYYQRFVSSDNVAGPAPHGPTPPVSPTYQPYLRVDYNVIPEASSIVIWSLLIGLACATKVGRHFHRRRKQS